MTTWTQSNFNGGEWSPLMFGRFNLDKYKTSVAKMLNFVPQIQGGITRRPGNRFVAEVKNSNDRVRTIRFEFSVTQGYCLEFGPGYVRFFANEGQVLNGGVPLEVATSYAADELFQLSFVQSADVLYITHQAHPPAKLERHSATNWTLTDIAFQDGPYLPLNVKPTTLTLDALDGSAINVTASSTIGINNDTGFNVTDIGRAIRIKNAGAWGWGTIIDAYTPLHVVVQPVVAFGGTPAVPGSATLNATSVATIPVTSGGSGYATAPGVTVGTPSTGGVQASAQAIVDKGVVTAILVTYPGAGYTAPPGVYIASPPSVPAPFTTTNWRLGVWSKTTGFPAAATFHEDRLFLGGCSAYPQRLDGSNTSDYENMAPTEVDNSVLATDGCGFSLNARDVNAIYWMLSDEKGLQVGGAGAEWLVRGDTNGMALTPTNIQAKPSTFYGSVAVEPVKAGRRTIFVQRGKRKIREASFAIQQDGFSAKEINAEAEHLSKTGVVQMALQRVPHQIVWMCRTDGLLVGMTYEYEEDVDGFHQHVIGGFSDPAKTLPAAVESICCVPSSDGQRDELWMSVRRTINGVTRRYIEVSTPFWDHGDSVAATSYLDASAAYVGPPVKTINGLGYLEGETVSVLGDGATHPNRVVVGGSINLNRPVSIAQVGLGYVSDLFTHRMEVQTSSGVGQMQYGRITDGSLRVTDTMGGEIGPDFDHLETILDRSSADRMDNAPALRSGDIIDLHVEDSFESYNQLAIRQAQPLPFNLQMMSANCEKASA